MSRGQYIGPRAARVTFKGYAEKWLKAHSADLSSQIVTERRLRLHAFPILGSRPLDSFRTTRRCCWTAGESIKAVSQYLGHTDPALTLRVYAHLMPSSQERTRNAIDGLFLPSPDVADGPETAQ